MSTAENELERIKKQNQQLQKDLAPFNDPYFKNLTSAEIAALAKKSIWVTTENGNMTNALIDINKELKGLNQSTPHEALVRAIQKVRDISKKFDPWEYVK